MESKLPTLPDQRRENSMQGSFRDPTANDRRAGAVSLSVTALLMAATGLIAPGAAAQENQPAQPVPWDTGTNTKPEEQKWSAPAGPSDQFSPALAVTLPFLTTIGLTVVGIAVAMINTSTVSGYPFSEIAGFTMAGLGLIVAPALGDIYLGRWAHAAGFTAGRLAFSAVGVLGAVAGIGAFFSHEGSPQQGDCGACGVALIGGALGLLVLDIAEPVSSGLFAQEANQRGTHPAVTIVPLVTRTAFGRPSLQGLALTTAF